MAFHNVRDKYGRFAPKPTSTPAPRRRRRVTPTNDTPKIIINGFLMDASGSMNDDGKYKAAIEGFNALVDQGRVDAKSTGVTNKEFVAFFGGSYKEVEQQVEKLVDGGGAWGKACGTVVGNNVVYNPTMGMTALWESTSKIINKLERELGSNPGAKVILTIFTDGEENNSSHQWRDGSKIKGIIEQKQKEGWVVTFIGAGDKKTIEQIATSVGIFASNSLSFANNSVGTKRAMAKMSASRSAYTTAVAAGTDSLEGFFSND